MNLKKIIVDYIQNIQSTSNLSQETIKAYKYDLQQFANYTQGKTISKELLKNYFSCLINKGYKSRSIIRKKVTLSLFLDYLKNNKSIKGNYIKELDLKIEIGHRLPRVVSIKFIKKILAFLKKNTNTSDTNYSLFKSYRNLSVFDLLITTGIRIGEASNIQLQDIDYTNRTILIHGKGKKERMIYISSNDCWNNLMKYISVRKTMSANTNYLFINKDLHKIGTHSIDKLFRQIIKELKLPTTITPHCLRHSFATYLLSNGADIRTVQELLGHASISTTEIYTHVDIKRKKKVLDKYNYRNAL